MGGESETSRSLIGRLARIGSLPEDTADEALRKEVLVLSAVLITSLAVVWVGTYWALGLYVAAVIPFTYQVISIINLSIFAKTKRYRFFRACELGLSLLLPFLLQLSLGGFVASSGVILWSFTAPLGALLFAGRREAVRWFIAFGVVMAGSGLIDPSLDSKATQIPDGISIVFFVLNILGVTVTCYMLLHYFVRERERYAAALAIEQERSERLLLNVLPERIAERLKAGESPIADGSAEVGVLFADIAGFTPMSETMSPEEVVRLLNELFSVFDDLTERFGLEKIKTIGDAYMVASGLLRDKSTHLEDLARMALAMRDEIDNRAKGRPLAVRIGIDAGPVVAGVIGRSKFIYDLWGDTVNTASRMESHGVSGSIQVTQRAYERLRDAFEFEPRGMQQIKGKGPMETYLLLGSRSEAETDHEESGSRGGVRESSR